MKKILSLIVLLLSGTFLFAQNDHQRNHNNDAPQQVQESFKKDHPDAENAHWAKSNGRYHASYNHDNRQTDSYYDEKGNHVYTRTQWDQKSLPADYDNRIRSKYHTSHYNVAKIERPNDKTLFELKLNTGKKARTVYTDEQGNRVNFKR